MTVPAGGRIVDREVRGVVVASFALAADGTLRGAASIDDPMTVKAARRIIDRGSWWTPPRSRTRPCRSSRWRGGEGARFVNESGQVPQ